MIKGTKKTEDKLSQDFMLRDLMEDFVKIPDHRAPNTVHDLSDVLMSGYAIFSLKHPSLLSFETQMKAEKDNLKSLFGIKTLCSDAQMRRTLDGVNPEYLQDFFAKRFGHLKQSKVLDKYLFLGKYYLVSIDGVEYFSSQKVKCEKCLTKQHKGCDVTYTHSMLGAVIVHPDQKEVFPIGNEIVQKQDGIQKNDCERNASKRLQNRMVRDYAKVPMVLVEDALYANEPHIEDVLNNGWDYIVTVKENSHKSLFTHFHKRVDSGNADVFMVEQQELDKKGKVKKDKKGNELSTKYYFKWIKNVPLNTQGKVRVNFLYCEEHDSKGKVQSFSWVTSLNITPNNVFEIMKGGRARWKIENETFNTLKNQGYNLEHNYGHGYNYLSNVMATLMLLAFLIDQIVQATNKHLQAVLAKSVPKYKIWEFLRACFMLTVMNSFEEFYHRLAIANAVDLESELFST